MCSMYPRGELEIGSSVHYLLLDEDKRHSLKANDPIKANVWLPKTMSRLNCNYQEDA